MTDTIGSSVKMCLKLQFGYCSNINKKWQKTENRKLKTDEKQKKRKADAAEYEMNDESEEAEYRPQSEIHEKYQLNSTLDNDDDMPYEYWHVQNGPLSVQEEYYIAMHRTNSELHVPEHSVRGSICICANILFGRNKYFRWEKMIRTNQQITIHFLQQQLPIGQKHMLKH